MAKKTLHVLLKNRTRLQQALTVETAAGDVALEAGRIETFVVTREQFENLYAAQRDAVRRKEGVPRMVDYWAEEDGLRVELEPPRQVPPTDATPE